MVLPMLLYGAAESWSRLTEAQQRQLETFHNSCLRSLTGHRLGPDAISNSDLHELTSTTSVSSIMRQHRLRWLGHAARKPDDTIVKQMLFAKGVPGAQPPMGRPHRTWMDAAMDDMQAVAAKVPPANPFRQLPHTWAAMAQDRELWKLLQGWCKKM
jgi:hypothetical protein